jgi:Phytanoyl-CoA dioxygenase (PhyH)
VGDWHVLTSNGYTLDESEARLGELASVPEAVRTDHSALWQRLRRDGYLLLRGQLDPELVSAFRSYYFDALEGVGLTAADSDPGLGLDSGGTVDRGALREILFKRIVPGETYAALCTTPGIRDWFGWFLESDVHLHKRKIIRHVRPGEQGIGTSTQAHYDLVYLREGTDRVLSAWIPLGDCPVERGGLVYLQESHRWALADEAAGTLKRPAASMTADLPGLADEHDSRWLATDYRAGDVVIHSAHMVHASTDNVDSAGVVRLSTDIRYQRTGDPIDWRWQSHWHPDDGL